MSKNVLPQFFEHLNEAQSASEAVDNHDLDSTDPDSVAEFQKLVRKQKEHGTALVEYVQKHGPAIIAALEVSVQENS